MRIWILIFLFPLCAHSIPVKRSKIENSKLEISFSNSSNHLWEYKIKSTGATMKIQAPIFEINGKNTVGEVEAFYLIKDSTVLKNGVVEYIFQGKVKGNAEINLKLIFLLSPGNAVVRYKYIISTKGNYKLTKIAGKDNITYTSVSFANLKNVKEVQFSNYDEKAHSYTLKEQIIEDRYFDNNYSAMGPMVVGEDGTNTFLLAYEHGSHYGNEFLHFNFLKDRTVSLSAVKGNYLTNHNISKGTEYETIWFEVAGINGGNSDIAQEYRSFMLKYISQNLESRKPYIFYNTWGRQERVKWKGGTYLQSMNLKQTLDEIEQSHQMGIDVYVIDAGWFLKTGDWQVNTNPNFFPDTLKQVVSLLRKHNMKLGLWFNPTVAALTSKMLARNVDCRTTVDGKMGEPNMVWETEKSVSLCLASKYYEDFSNELIRLVKELGVTYFKWDAIWQGDCDRAGHYHGDVDHTMEERKEYDAFLQPIYMAKIVDKVCKACPEAIIDFDITEDGRCVGLAFLAAGKYFAINNGPYFHNYDLSKTWKSPLANGNANIFVYPGPARGWFTRSVLSYDKWIPSTLFLTHYQPDEPRNSQILNLASLILGQNGIWGDVLQTSPEGVKLFGEVLGKYKIVKDDITLATPTVVGQGGEPLEIHEKINVENGKGTVVIFGIGKREITYITKLKPDLKNWHNEGVAVTFDDKGRAIIKATFEETSAKIIFFGVE